MGKSDVLLAKIREGQDLTEREKLGLIVNLSVPSILAQISSTLMFFIDASMVGSLGANASASVGIVETSTWLFTSLTSAASMGFGVQVAHRIGANDFVGARRVMRTGLATVLMFALLLCIVAVVIHGKLPLWLGGGADIAHDASLYFLIFSLSLPVFQLCNFSMNMLKCSGNMRVPSLLSIQMCVLDVLFNFICIYPTHELTFLSFTFSVPGLGWGVAGAAVGTALAFVVTASLAAYAALCKSPITALRLDRGQQVSWRPDMACLKKAFGISSPLALQYSLMNGAQMVSTVIVAPLGNFAIAANSFAITAESLCYMPGYGVAEAATTLVGQSAGARRWGLCRGLACRCVAIGMTVMAFMGGVMYVFAPELMGLMTPVSEIVNLGVQALRIEAFVEPMFAAAIVCNSCMVGAGDTIIPACMNLVSMWGMRLSIAAWLAPVWGLAGAWTGMAIELSFRGAIFLFRLFKGGWLKKAMKV